MADNPVEINLTKGKNNFTINESFESNYASELIKEYPKIESISIKKYGNTYGYINTFGGLGIDIIIEPMQEYEIYVKENLSVNLN